MSDFFLDLRPVHIRQRPAAHAAGLLTFCGDTRAECVETPEYSLALTRVDDPLLWGPARSPDGLVTVALGGRIAMDEPQWEAAGREEGSGGLACKAILGAYRRGGIHALRDLNGNFAVLIADHGTGQFHLVTDRCGMFMCYVDTAAGAGTVVSSHPDILAAMTGTDRTFDMVSLTEFLLTGRLTFPNTYFERVKALDPGCIYTLDMKGAAPAMLSRERYAELRHNIIAERSERDLAGQMADAFRAAVRRRTLPRLGSAGIGLSGGLDSRAIIGAAPAREHLHAFCLYDEENNEYRTARSIASAFGVDFIPMQRDFDHYGSSAELGVRIGGGTGCIASNHFLAVRPKLQALGFRSILTGCYCDYLFKALSLNTRERKLSRREELVAFDYEFYRPYYRRALPLAPQVLERMHGQFPEADKDRLSDEDWLRIERGRSFPLAYEGDQAQRVIAQRVLPWYPFIVDNDVIRAYLQIPSRSKLNVRIFSAMLPLLCGPDICRIPDANTGAPVNSSHLRFMAHRYASALQERLKTTLRPGIAMRGSWPNWEYYIAHSTLLRSQWDSGPEATWDVLHQVLGSNPRGWNVAGCKGREVEWFLRLWTLKLWLDQRHASR